MRALAPRRIPNPTPPICCDEPARLTTGREIYPHRPDLNERRFWKCDRCEAYCGTHKKSWEPLGFPAGPELRAARQHVHSVLDPIWMTAWTAYPDGAHNRGALRQTARGRVYRWLAAHLGIDRENCQTAMFDIEQCRRAWKTLQGVTYFEIREWAKAQQLTQGRAET